MAGERVWEAEIELSEEQAKSLIEEQFPALRPVTLAFSAAGWDNWVFSLRDRWMFRFPRRHLAVRLMEREIRVLPLLAPHVPVPVPNPVWVGRPVDRYPYPFAGYVRLPGRPVQEVDVPDRERQSWGEDLGRFLAALHRLKPSDVGLDPAEDRARGLDLGALAALAEKRLSRARALGLWRGGDPAGLIGWARDQGASWVLSQADRVSQVIHGDLNFRNVLIAPDGTIASVVDWGDVRVGHPSVDLSMVYALLPLEAERAFEAAYGQVPDLWRWVGRFVAVFISLAILVSAQDLGVPREIREAQLCLERLAVGPRP